MIWEKWGLRWEEVPSYSGNMSSRTFDAISALRPKTTMGIGDILKDEEIENERVGMLCGVNLLNAVLW
jgi:hypothetical protein